MFWIILIMLCGLGSGYALRRIRLVFVSRLIMILICALLFLLGFEVGGSPRIVAGLHMLGSEACLLSMAGVTGSIMLSWLFWLWSTKRKQKE